MKSDRITYEANILIKKSRQVRNRIKKLEINDAGCKVIIKLLIDDTYEFNNFHSISALFQVISPTKTSKEIWYSVDKLMISYTEEFNSDTELYEIIMQVMQNKNVTDNEKSALNKIIKSLKKYGAHLDKNALKKINTITDNILELESTITELIISGNNVALDNYIPQKFFDEMDEHIAIAGIHKYVKINKQIFDKKNNDSNIDENIKKIIKNIYDAYCNDIFEKVVKLLIFRHELSNELNFGNYSDLKSNGCMNGSDINVIKEVVIGLDKTAKLEISELLKKQNTTENISSVMMHKLISDKRYELLLKIGTFNVENILSIVIKIFEKIFKIKFSLMDTKSWHTDVKLYNINDEITGKEIGFIYFDLMYRKGKRCTLTCIELMQYANYPYGSNEYRYGSSAILGNFRQEMAYNDIVIFAHKLCSAIHNISGTTKFSILNGIECEYDFRDVPGLVVEKLFWDPAIISEILIANNKNIKNVENVRSLLTIDLSINIKNKCVIALFDKFIHSSKKFIEMCSVKNKNITLISTFNSIYGGIIQQVMGDITPYNNFTIIEPNMLLPYVSDYSGMICNLLISEIIATNLYTKVDSNELFYKLRAHIMSNYKMNTKNILTEHFLYNTQINKTKIIKTSTNNVESDNFSLDDYEKNDCDFDDGSETNCFAEEKDRKIMKEMSKLDKVIIVKNKTNKTNKESKSSNCNGKYKDDSDDDLFNNILDKVNKKNKKIFAKF